MCSECHRDALSLIVFTRLGAYKVRWHVSGLIVAPCVLYWSACSHLQVLNLRRSCSRAMRPATSCARAEHFLAGAAVALPAGHQGAAVLRVLRIQQLHLLRRHVWADVLLLLAHGVPGPAVPVLVGERPGRAATLGVVQVGCASSQLPHPCSCMPVSCLVPVTRCFMLLVLANHEHRQAVTPCCSELFD